MIKLIIGGSGLIGINLYLELIKRNQEAYIIDNLSGENSYNLNLIDKEHFIYCDIRDEKKLTQIIRDLNPQIVYNLAAHFANQKSIYFPHSDIETNIIGQLNIINAISKLKNLEKVFYASSSSIYESKYFSNESEAVYPHGTPYSINKFVGELYFKYFHLRSKTPVIIGRLFNTYGPGEVSSDFRNVIPRFIHNALINSPLIISGKGKETRDFTFVGDLVNILIRLVESKNINDFSIFNIGTGIETEIKKLSTLIIDLCDSQSEITYISSRDWDQTTKRKSNNLKLLEQFDLEFTPLEIGLEKTIKWYKSLR
tara:strand:- start:2 stop:937 length:936 start_codon:yes stop_codon:yes gene_type:complete